MNKVIVLIFLVCSLSFPTVAEDQVEQWSNSIIKKAKEVNLSESLSKTVLIERILIREPSSSDKIDLIRWPSEDRLMNELGEQILEGN